MSWPVSSPIRDQLFASDEFMKFFALAGNVFIDDERQLALVEQAEPFVPFDDDDTARLVGALIRILISILPESEAEDWLRLHRARHRIIESRLARTSGGPIADLFMVGKRDRIGHGFPR